MQNLNKKLLNLSMLFLFTCLFTREGAAQSEINYTYDAAGNRIKRKVTVYFQRTEHADKDSVIANSISVYPNPANDKINITVTSATEFKSATFYLIDNNGKTLAQEEVNAATFSFDISKYNPGTYFIRLIMGKEQLIYRVVKTY